MEGYRKIDSFQFMNNFILVVKQKNIANMHLRHSIVIIVELVCNSNALNMLGQICFSLVEFTEFILAIAITQSGDVDDRLALAFEMYDYNNSGSSKLNFSLK